MLALFTLAAVILMPVLQRRQQVKFWNDAKESRQGFAVWFSETSGVKSGLQREFPSPLASWLRLPRLFRFFDQEFSAYQSVDGVLIYREPPPALKSQLIHHLKSCINLSRIQWLGEFDAAIASSLSRCKNLSRVRVLNCQSCDHLLDTFAKLKHLQVIELVNCELTSEQIERLKILEQVNLMVLADSAVEPDQVLDTQEALPDCFVVAFKQSELE